MNLKRLGLQTTKTSVPRSLDLAADNDDRVSRLAIRGPVGGRTPFA